MVRGPAAAEVLSTRHSGMRPAPTPTLVRGAVALLAGPHWGVRQTAGPAEGRRHHQEALRGADAVRRPKKRDVMLLPPSRSVPALPSPLVSQRCAAAKVVCCRFLENDARSNQVKDLLPCLHKLFFALPLETVPCRSSRCSRSTKRKKKK